MAEEKTRENLIEGRLRPDDSQDFGELKPPVVVVLGHVDHGKSSLLEAVREDFVITAKEAGGITQHIGAYEVEAEIKKGGDKKKITFIDTPGHEAFSAMRQRGAKIADIAVLVIDASEGVKAQTKEAIKFAKQADAPLIIAFNKIDKPGADPEKVKGQLSKEQVLVESYGGKVPSVNVSAKEKKGIDELLETILLVAELEGLKADLSSAPSGVVIESQLNPQKGPLAVLILKQGILERGAVLATSSAIAKVKTIFDFQGREIAKALPSQPVSVLGFDNPPSVGESFKACQTMEQAKLALQKAGQERKSQPVIEVGEGMRVLNIILKSDVLGTAEAIEGILKDLPQEKVVLRVLHSGAGEVNLNDVKTAESGRSRIFAFRVSADGQAKQFAQQKGVSIKTFEVIYELIQEVRRQMTAILAPEVKRLDLAKFKVTHLFKQTKQAQIIGGKVLEGEITLNTKAEVLREEEVIGAGRIKGLQQNKQNVGKVEKGREAGLNFEGDVKVEENDILQVFRQEKQKGSL